MKTVSVIVSVYNVERYLEECLLSIVKQSYKKLEIICINDGSDDRSFDIINYFSKLDSRVLVIDQDNKGLSSTRNIGIDIAKGDYIYFMDGDDFLSLNYIESMVTLIEKDNSEVVHNPNFEMYYSANDSRNTKINIHSDNAFNTNVITHSTWSKLYSLSFLKSTNIRFYEGLRHQDYEHWNRLIAHIKNISFSSEGVYYYRQRSSSITESSKKIFYNNHILIALDSIYKYYLNNKNNRDLLFKPVNISIVKNHLFDQPKRYRIKFAYNAFIIINKINDNDFISMLSKDSYKTLRYFKFPKIIFLVIKSLIKKR